MTKQIDKNSILDQIDSNIREALLGARPAIASRYADYANTQIDAMFEELGKELKGRFSSRWSTMFGAHATNPMGKAVRMDEEGEGYHKDDEAVQAYSEMMADAVLESWAGKIHSKLEGIENPKVEDIDGLSFTITGKKLGHHICARQRMIVNYKGWTMYNQFPCRIYVDGKSSSEAEFKALTQLAEILPVEDEKPKSKGKKVKPPKKAKKGAEKRLSNEAKMYELVKGEASDKAIEAEFKARYEGKDEAFVAKRIKIYRTIAERKIKNEN